MRKIGLDPQFRKIPQRRALQHSCLENPMDRGVWWATSIATQRVWPLLKQLSMHRNSFLPHQTSFSQASHLRILYYNGKQEMNFSVFSQLFFLQKLILHQSFICYILYFYYSPTPYYWASLVAQLVKNPPAMQGTSVGFLGGEDRWRSDRLPTPVFLGFPCGSAVKNQPAMQETWV